MALGRRSPHRLDRAWLRGERIRRDAGLALLATAMALAAPALFAPGVAAGATEDIIAPSDPHAPTVESGWQAGTCSEEPPESADFCSVATPGQFFERASAHPNWGFTQFIVRHEDVLVEGKQPVGELETVRVDLPVGLSVNPGATERCPLATFEAGASGCPEGSKVGVSEVTASPPPLFVPVGPLAPLTKVPVYNVTPPPGEPARFGLELAGNEVFLEADVDWAGDYHEGFTIAVPKALPLPGIEGLILQNRLVFDGRAGDGSFITTPSTCLGEAFTESGSVYSTYLLAASYGEEAEPGYSFPGSAAPRLESPIPPGTSPKECATIPYAPAIAVDPGAAATDSPAGAAVAIDVPHLVGADGQDSSDTRTARVTLPPGMGINPAAADGLRTCTDAQFGKGTRSPVACPAASRIGSVRISSPPLPEGDLEGPVYVGQQLSRDPTSGREYRIFVDAESARYGVSVRLVGAVRADPVSGRLTTTFADNPQVPFTSFRLAFDPGARAVLSSPPTCGPHRTSTVMTPWSGNAPATPGDAFTLAAAPGGGPCAASMAARPFAPGFGLGPASTRAGAFSPLALTISRDDGEQELKGADVTLAPGMTASLAGIPYCTDGELARAATRAGRDEAATPGCPVASRLGTATIDAGTGPRPLRIGGTVFLSGPYHGAPLSLAVLTPATAGPFDLGTVVVRVALFVDPETARVRAVSDPIPDVFGGAKLSIRSVRVDLDRPRFARNPTSCDPLASAGALAGGGADPANPASFSSAPVAAPFQTSECRALGFHPKLYTRLFGGRKAARRSGHPKLRTVLLAREGDADIRRAAVTLPHSEFLDPQNVGIVCTRPRLAAHDCPPRSRVGYARARTPLLDGALAGPVYLVPSDHPLPDLLAELHGQVDIRLRGTVSSARGRIKTVFETVPDVPVSKFVLAMKGGPKGLLENSRNLCKGRNVSFVDFEAHNGKRRKVKRLPLRMAACGGKHRKRHRDHRRARD